MGLPNLRFEDQPEFEEKFFVLATEPLGTRALLDPQVRAWLGRIEALPGFVAMCPGGYPVKEEENWTNAFLPGAYQGTYVDTKHTDVGKLKRGVELIYRRNPGLKLRNVDMKRFDEDARHILRIYNDAWERIRG